MKYESPTSNGSKVTVKVKVFRYVGQRPRSRSLGQNFWYGWKGLLTRNVYVKYESPTSNRSKVMAKVKVFIARVTDRVTEGTKIVAAFQGMHVSPAKHSSR